MDGINKDPLTQTIDNIPLPKKVAIIYTDSKKEYFKTDETYTADADSDIYAADIAKYVSKMQIEVETFPGDDNLAFNLKRFSPDLALNLVDSVRGQMALGAGIPGLLEVMHIPYTGTGILGYSINCNKFVTYQLLQSSGVPVPVHQLVNSPGDMIDPELRYPLLPKLNNEHSSIGIDPDSVCRNERELRAKLKDLFTKYKQPVLIDEFIAGIEITSAVLDSMNTKVYSVQRTVGDGTTDDLVTFESKWKNYLDIKYEKYDDPVLREYTKKAFDILKYSDYARIDVRIDAAGRYFFIDPNSNPFFGPPSETHSTYSIILDMYGISFEDTLKRIFLNTSKDAIGSQNGWSL